MDVRGTKTEEIQKKKQIVALHTEFKYINYCIKCKRTKHQIKCQNEF